MSIQMVRRAILSVSRLVTALATVWCLTPTQASAMEATQHLETIVVGAGCFWGVEKRHGPLWQGPEAKKPIKLSA